MPNHCLDELERLECNVVPADILDYAEKHVGSILLDSVSQGYGFGRYSIFACSPRKEILAHRDRIEIITTEGSEIRRGDPLESLRFELGNPSNEVFPKREIPLLGGALGYFAYDFGRRLRKPSLGFDKVRESPDMRFYLYDAVLVWDHLSEELFLARDSREEGAERTSEFLKSILRDCRSGDKTGVFEVGPLASNISRQDFLENVESVRRLILEGEIYQANLSRGYSASFQGSSAALYRRLRMENPAPYSAYMNFGDEIIL